MSSTTLPRLRAKLFRRGTCRLRSVAVAVLGVLVVLPSAAFGQPLPFLVKDINTATEGSGPGQITNVDGTIFFTASTDLDDTELWKSDGVTAARVADLVPGPNGSRPEYLTALGDTLYFRACDPTHGCELWKSDGVDTALVADLNPGAGDSNPDRFTIFGGTLFFTAWDPTNGYELRKLDGTSITLVADLNPGTASSYFYRLTAVGGTLFFPACQNIATTGCALWKTDGVATVPVAAIVPDADGEPMDEYALPPQDAAAVGGTLFFRACDAANGCELWKSDGVTASLVADVNPGIDDSLPADLTNVDGTLFFTAYTSAHGYELWKSDGVTTSLVADLVPGADTSYPGALTAHGGTLFFRACDAANGCELRKTDGVTTALVADIEPGPASSNPGRSERRLTDIGGTLFFQACTASQGCEVWKSDGVETALVAELVPGIDGSRPYGFTDVNGTLVFSAFDPTRGYELWKSDGSTTTAIDANTRALGSTPLHLTDGGGVLFLSADDAISGREVWKSDGTTSGTVRVADLVPGVGGVIPCELAMVDGTLFFTASSPNVEGGSALWKSDGAGASFVAEIHPHSCQTSTSYLTALGNVLFYRACERVAPFVDRCTLRKTDGITTSLVADFPPFDLTVAGGNLFFRSDAAPNGHSLWKTNGVTTVPFVGDFSFAAIPTDVNGTLFFTALTDATGFELWKSDGDSTSLVADIVPGRSSSLLQELTNVAGTLFFRACEPVHGCELWRSDGVTTSLVADIYPGGGSYPQFLTAVGGTLYFVACAPTTGCELWTSDGTSVSLVADIEPGAASPFIFDVEDVGDTLYFQACTVTHGCELWRSDGAGAVLVADLVPGNQDSSPSGLTNVGGTLFFAASDDGTHNRELWALAASCGNGAANPGEECDDGNGVAGDGCDASCRLETSPGSTATPVVIPTPTATATPLCPAQPAAGCRPPGVRTKDSLVLEDKTLDRTDWLLWKWVGALGAPRDFGDPSASGAPAYQLCVYDGAPALILDATIPSSGRCAKSKPCWKKTTRGWVYTNDDAAPDGIRRVELAADVRRGTVKIAVRGRGERLDDPTFPLVQPVTVQLHGADGSVCWEAVYSAPAARARARRFTDTAD